MRCTFSRDQYRNLADLVDDAPDDCEIVLEKRAPRFRVYYVKNGKNDLMAHGRMMDRDGGELRIWLIPPETDVARGAE